MTTHHTHLSFLKKKTIKLHAYQQRQTMHGGNNQQQQKPKTTNANNNNYFRHGKKTVFAYL